MTEFDLCEFSKSSSRTKKPTTTQMSGSNSSPRTSLPTHTKSRVQI